MKCSLGISNFLQEISSLSYSIVFLYFLSLITEEGFLTSPCYSLELCIQMGISFPFSFAFHFCSQLFLRPPQTTFCLFAFLFLGHGLDWLSGAGAAAAWCWSDFKEIPNIQGWRRSPSKKVGEAKSRFESNPLPTREAQRAQSFCAPGPRDPTETEPKLCLSVSCSGMGQQWPIAGAGARGAADPGVA